MPTKSDAIERAKGIDLRKSSEIGEIKPIGDLLFTGTGLSYARAKLKSARDYVVSAKGVVFLTPLVGAAVSWGSSRAIEHHDVPIVLVIDAKSPVLNLRRDTRVSADIIADPIPLEAILDVYDVSVINKSDLMFSEGAQEQYEILQKKGIKVKLID